MSGEVVAGVEVVELIRLFVGDCLSVSFSRCRKKNRGISTVLYLFFDFIQRPSPEGSEFESSVRS